MIDLAQYRSPKIDCSVYYWIPIQHLEEVRKRLGGKYFRYVYRGPRLNLLKRRNALPKEISLMISMETSSQFTKKVFTRQVLSLLCDADRLRDRVHGLSTKSALLKAMINMHHFSSPSMVTAPLKFHRSFTSMANQQIVKR